MIIRLFAVSTRKQHPRRADRLLQRRIRFLQHELDGDLFCTGSKSAVVPVDNGQRQVALYAVEAPQNWFEDFGSGRLTSAATVERRIDR